jgi:hypothetical protein
MICLAKRKNKQKGKQSANVVKLAYKVIIQVVNNYDMR